MTLNNNLSILPFYEITTANPEPRDDQRWWVYGHKYPLFAPKGGSIPVQFNAASIPSTFTWYNAKTGANAGSGYYSIFYKTIDGVYYACFNLGTNLAVGQYYCKCSAGGKNYVSDVVTIVQDITPYLKLEWWDNQDLIMDGGAIIYTNSVGVNNYKNVLYLPTELAKPSYEFEEEGENRDGYFFALKQISQKRYRFTILAPEYLCDVMRFIRLSDNIQITYRGQLYKADTFLMTPTWESEGDLAKVECEFTTNTVAKKIGRIITP